MYITLGQCPRISSFQLQQGGHHVAFTIYHGLEHAPAPQFVRTAPDQQYAAFQRESAENYCECSVHVYVCSLCMHLFVGR